MFVLQPEAIEEIVAVRMDRAGVILERRDQRLAAAGIARHGVDGDRVFGGQQPGGHQRMQDRDRGDGIAAGVGDARRGFNQRPLAFAIFRETIDPAVRRPVRGGRIDNAGGAVFDQSHGIAGRIVGQAKDRNIGAIERVPAGIYVFPPIIAEMGEYDIGAAPKPIQDLQAGGTGFAIDKNIRRHGLILNRRTGFGNGGNLRKQKGRSQKRTPLPLQTSAFWG